MPLEKKCSRKAMQRNIDRMRHERGGPHNPPDDQTKAIAYSVLRKACGIRPKARKMTPKEIIANKKEEQFYNDPIQDALTACDKVLGQSVLQ